MEISEKIGKIISDKLGIDLTDIKSESRFMEDLGCDSLDRVELIMEMEKEFNLTIPDEEMETIFTVQDAINLIEKKIN